jgi:hypothetical protein
MHELPAAFERHGLPLCTVLVDMLDEHHEHRTERRGCGYTQSTRHLADLVNRGDSAISPGLGVFHRDLERTPDALRQRFGEVKTLIHADLALPESRLWFGIVADLLHPLEAGKSTIPAAAEKLKVGSCPLAEQFFLEIAHGRIRRGGRVNLILATDGHPVLLEKRGLGDDHSCISLDEFWLNGVRLPRGSLFAVDYADADVAHAPSLSGMPGLRIAAAGIRACRFLRLTTLAVAPPARKRAFSAHFEQQVKGGLFSPGETRIEDLQRAARRALT